jgi:hypothetical protein
VFLSRDPILRVQIQLVFLNLRDFNPKRQCKNKNKKPKISNLPSWSQKNKNKLKGYKGDIISIRGASQVGINKFVRVFVHGLELIRDKFGTFLEVICAVVMWETSR